MSNFNVQKDSWLDITFENRNKKYGAYQLRKENDRTTLKALFFGSAFCFIGLGLFSFTTKNEETLLSNPTICTLTPDVVEIIKPIEKKIKKIETKGTENPKQNKTPNENIPPKVVENHDVKPVDLPKNPDYTTPYNPNGDPNGNPGPKGTPNGPETTTITPTETGNEDNGLYTGVLGVEASFPGGIEKFRNYVAKNYTIPESFEKDFLKIDLIFTIAKDGTMTDIRIINKVDKALEKEAIRVIKAMNKKWTPGLVNGKPVTSERKFSIQLDVREFEE